VSAAAQVMSDGGATPEPRGGGAHGALYPLLALGLAGLVFAPILANYFHADDFYYLYMLNDHRPLEFLLTPHGGHMLLVRNAAFALCHALFGVDPRGYFALVLLTHLANVLLLYQVVRELTASQRVACFGAALWGMCPVNEGSLGWYSVYGHVLAATLMLWVLRQVIRAGHAPETVRWWAPWLWYLALLLASMSFGVGMAVAMVFPAVVALLLRPRRFRATRWAFWSLPLLVVALYRALLRLHALVARHLDPTALMLADMARALWWIIPAVAIHLVNAGVVRLLLGPFDPAAAYPSRLAYGVATAFYLAALVVFAAADGLTRRRILACALLAGGAYTIIAIGRGPLLPDLSATPDSVARWPRYQYLGTLPLAVILCLIVDWMGARLRVSPHAATALLAVWLMVSGIGYLRSGHRIEHYARDRAAAAAFQSQIIALVDAQPGDAPVYIPNRVFASIDFMGMNWGAFPGWAAMFIAYFPDNTVHAKRVFFVDGHSWLVDWVRQECAGTRTAQVLVREDEHTDP
jgi:hypothetical protein